MDLEAHTHTPQPSLIHTSLRTPNTQTSGLSGEESVGGDGTGREEERVVANGDSRSDDNIGGDDDAASAVMIVAAS